ncbi:MAG: hypothetical protein JOY82_19025 [Streptosporangiaceae bacterium]|nr:hypothetical protein [Streptosporangiaceae bacterium]MBV9856578.1 hypothetical protein [Streptosporangiaceae bacterium]
MDPIFPQRGHAVCASPAATPADSAGPAPRSRLDRLAGLGPEDKTAGLVWLAVHSPAVCDAMLGALEQEDEELACQEPEPYCAACGADVGIFLRSGLDWRHFRGNGTTGSPIELFNAGHAPAIAWRAPSVTTAR